MKLQVGDIQMDSDSGVSFGRAWVEPARVVAEPSSSVLAAIGGAPSWAHALVALGAGLGGVALIAAAALTGFWPLLVPGLVALRGSAYAAMMSVGSHLPQRRSHRKADARALLAAVEARGTGELEHFADELQWSEGRTAAALLVLIERGSVEEDLDVDTGHWVYRPVRVLSGLERRNTLTAADRLRAIEHEQPLEVCVED